jgi:hypothetical protein
MKLAKLNLLNSKSLDDILSYSTSYPNEINYTTDFFGHDDIKYSDSWQKEHFNYKINNYGFRGTDLPNSTDIAAFGCSFTFGTGLPEEMLWHRLLSVELNKTSVNFGLPSRSISSMIDMFLILSQHIQIKNAVFLFPSLTRLQIAKNHPNLDILTHLNICNDVNSAVNKDFGIDSSDIYRSIPLEDMYKICKNQIYLLDYIARLRNISIYISSWENQTYNFLKLMELESIVLLPEWTSQYVPIDDKARDKKHPGPLHHVKWMNQIKGFIK